MNVDRNSHSQALQPSPGANSMSSSIATSPDCMSAVVTTEYYQELLKDKQNLQNFPNVFHHVDRILETEIGRARSQLYHQNGSSRRLTDDLPEADGPVVTVQEKVFIPVKENPNYNFVGRLLGPRGMTAKQLETDLDCKIMIRGKGSMRDKKKEEQNRGKPNWEHLSEDLHVLVSVEDHQNRAEIKAKRAADEIRVFLEQAVKMQSGQDSAKRLQLAELAVMKGTFRPGPSQGSVRPFNCLQLAGQLQATRASNAVTALSMAAAAAQQQQLPQHLSQLTPAAAASFLRMPTAAAAGFHQHHLAAAQQLLLQGQQQQLLGLPILQPAVSASGGGADLSAYLLAAAAAAAAANTSQSATGAFDSSLMSLMYPGGAAATAAAAASGLDVGGGQTGPMKSRQQLGGGPPGSVRPHPYSRPAF